MAERANCHAGTPKGKRVSMIMGEVNGIIENQNANGPSGDFIPLIITIMARIRGRVIGSVSCWVSVTLSTAEPTAANMAAYNR
jgi:hypothetical protein